MCHKPPLDVYSHKQALEKLVRPCPNCEEVIGIWGGKVENFITDDMPEHGTSASSGVQPTTSGPGPRASGAGTALPTRRQRPSPDDDLDTSAPEKG